jgi:hypothetical protein
MTRLVLDIETNGLLDRKDLKVLCVVTRNLDTGAEERYRGFGHPDDELDAGRLAEALRGCTELIGHNLAGFDLPVLERYFGPDWAFGGTIYDTLCVSQSRFNSTIGDHGWALRRSAQTEEEAEARYPLRLTARNKLHSLEAWGYRLGLHKGAFLQDSGVQEMWSQELEDYCARDVDVTVALWHRLLRPEKDGTPEMPEEAMRVESLFAYLLSKQQRHGIRFDVEAAQRLYAELCGRRDALASELKAMVGPWYQPVRGKGDPLPADYPRDLVQPGDASVRVPKVTYKNVQPLHNLAGREKDCPFTPVEVVEFNPASREMVANRLIALHGWRPTAVTPTGEPQVDDAALATLSYPIAAPLREYYLVSKMIAQLAEGEGAWLKLVTPAGLIHGRVIASGARTNRCSHSGPNLAQVPKVGSPFGAECRSLFGPVRKGWKMVGVDAKGCQLRMLAHRLAFYDDGAFGRVLLEGDPHETWRQISGLFYRENQKTLTYAFLFGAGDRKLGSIVLADWQQAHAAGVAPTPPRRGAIKALGAKAKAALLKQVPGLSQLLKACKAAHVRGWVRTLDGRVVRTKSEHGVLNDVLQGDEAVLMRHARTHLYATLRQRGVLLGPHYAWLLDVHDEWQFECPPQMAPSLGEAAAAAITAAGEKLGCRVPMAGDWKVGDSWKETH